MFKKKDKKSKDLFVPQDDADLSASENAEEVDENAYENLDDADKLTNDILNGKISETDSGSSVSDAQREKDERLEGIKDKISQILRTQGIEIVDENEGDEFDDSQNDKKSQQDYDELKSIFGDDAKSKNKQLTLTIDDFDYTYVGQYVDEFDLLHVKNIKHIKMPHKFPKPLKRALIAASILVVLGLGAFLAYWFTRDIPVYVTNVTLSQDKGYYLAGQVFNYDEIYLVASYSNGRKDYVKLVPDHYSSGKGTASISDTDPNSITFNQIGEVILTFNYAGFYVDYNVDINAYQNVGLDAIVVPTIFENKPTYFSDNNLCVMMVKKVVADGDEKIEEHKRISINDENSGITIEIMNGGNVSTCSFHSGVGFRLNESTTFDENSILRVKYLKDNESFTLLVACDEEGNIIFPEVEDI